MKCRPSADAHTGVPNLDTGLRPPPATADDDRALRSVADGIGDEVVQNPFQQDRVASNPDVAFDYAQFQSLAFGLVRERRGANARAEASPRRIAGWVPARPASSFAMSKQRVEQVVHRADRLIDLGHETLAFLKVARFPQLRDEQVQGA